MRKFDENDYEKVKGYEPKFRTAIDSRYVSGLIQDDLKVIAEVYQQTLNRRASLNCGACVLQMMTQVGRLYFTYKENMEVEKDERKKDIKGRNSKRAVEGKSGDK